MTNLIGMTGFKRSGKDTVAKIIEAMWNDGDAVVHRVGFADKLKIAAARALGFEGSDSELIAFMDEAKECWEFDIIDATNFQERHIKTITGRQYLQWWGTEAGRDTFWPNFWIDLVLPNPETSTSGWALDGKDVLDSAFLGIDLVIVTDARFPNEAERIKALGGRIFEVVRDGTGGDGHSSETPLPREFIDATIDNNGTLSDLERAVEAVL